MFAVLAEDGAQHPTDLADACRGFGSLDEQGHEIGIPLRSLSNGVESPVDGRTVALGFEFLETFELPLLDFRGNTGQFGFRLGTALQGVDSDDQALAGLDLLLVAIRGVLDLLLDEAALDGGNHPSEFVDARLVADAKARGLEVYVYTVNDPEEYRRLAALGIDGVFTDYPDRLRRLCD